MVKDERHVGLWLSFRIPGVVDGGIDTFSRNHFYALFQRWIYRLTLYLVVMLFMARRSLTGK